MRVPDLPKTSAKYAAPINLMNINNLHEVFSNEHNYVSFQEPRITTLDCNTLSGEEFVNRALNSSYAEIYNNYNSDVDSTTSHSYGKQSDLPQMNQYIGQCSDSDVATGKYKNFAAPVSVKRRHYSINNISNIQYVDEERNNHKKRPNPTSISLIKDETDEVEINNNLQRRKSETNITEQYQRTNLHLTREYNCELSQNDCNDQYMIDLDSDTNSIEDGDERDDSFFTSSSGSSDILHLKPHLYFPHGIVNPNYPGFQHLAHTLTEHFRNNSPYELYDSDMSLSDKEFHIAGSLDSLIECISQTHLNKCNNNDIRDISPSDESRKDEILDNNILLATPNMGYNENAINDCTNINQQGHNNNNSTDCNYHNDVKMTESLSEYLIAQGRNSTYSIQPDILMKNIELEIKNKNENRPDLLNGVSPQLLRKHKGNNYFNVDKTVTIKSPSKTNTELSTSFTNLRIKCQETNEDIMPLGLTPVNIIGDFGLEVEREFGLLVSGYKRVDNTKHDEEQILFANTMEHMEDKNLQSAFSKINKEINSNNCFTDEEQNQINEKQKSTTQVYSKFIDNHENDYDPIIMDKSPVKQGNISIANKSPDVSEQRQLKTRKYQKCNYDDRQLPPIAFDYKIPKSYTQNDRSLKKSSQNSKIKCERQQKQQNNFNRANPRCDNKIIKSNDSVKLSNTTRKLKEENDLEEYNQYQQLLRNKNEILNNSKYAKLCTWAQYVKDPDDRKNSVTNSLELIDAYKICSDIDAESLEKHIKLAKEIEKKRRNEREEIRRRLAMGGEMMTSNANGENKTKSRSYLQSDCTQIIETSSSDTETNSSDSETCPKLSKYKFKNCKYSPNDVCVLSDRNKQTYHDSCSTLNQNYIPDNITINGKENEKQSQPMASMEDIECDFFTKQARLQIETRMALAQAKEMAHRQMEINRQNCRISPITVVIRDTLQQMNIFINHNTRRVSRHMLTELNTIQLQILVNKFHIHIKELNDTLVNYLMERDDLHLKQDAMFADIQELTCYLGATEHIAHQERLSKYLEQQRRTNNSNGKNGY